MFVNSENEIGQLGYEKNNQKVLTDGGVQLYFSNVFVSNGESKLPTIKNKLRKILVNFGLGQTCLEVNQSLNYVKIWYIDEQAIKLKGFLLQRYNSNKESQAIELDISLEGSLVSSPSKLGKIKTYTGLTNFLYREFIQSTKSRSLVDDDPYNQMEEIIKQGNLAACLPLSAILAEEVG